MGAKRDTELTKMSSCNWRFESRISPPFRGGLYGTDNSGRHRTSGFDVIHPVGRFADRLRHGGDWFAIACRRGGQRGHCVARRLSRRGPRHARLSRAWSWQHDLEAPGWARICLLRCVPDHASAGGSRIAYALVLASLFLIEGVLDIILFFKM